MKSTRIPPWVKTVGNSLQSLLSIQVLSGSICLFCIAYFFLSFFYSTSITTIIGGLGFQPKQTRINTTTNITKLLSIEGKLLIANRSQINHESFICDYVKNTTEHQKANIPSFTEHRISALRPYCDIVPTPRNKWTSASRYLESDIVFLIYTGAAFYHGRATAIRDTWLSRVTHKYFFSSTPYATLPITVIEGAGENYLSNMKKLYVGMQIAYLKHNQTAKFYYLAGCDTFVNVPHILKRLDRFDHTQPLVIGGYPFGHICYKNKNQTLDNIQYPSGGAGFFLSARLMEMMYPKINPFFENDWPSELKPYSDVALNCLANSMGIRPTLVPGFWAFSPEQTLKDSGRAQLHADPEPNTFHYVQPPSMYILDEFYIFQYVDRLANDQNLNELVKFTRKFIAAHYELLRIKNIECTLPPVKSRKK